MKSNYQKIGIGLIIYRQQRGNRESLEVKTMNTVKNVAKFYTDTLKYLDDASVECLADACIGGLKINLNFLQEYLGMRLEYVEASEMLR